MPSTNLPRSGNLDQEKNILGIYAYGSKNSADLDLVAQIRNIPQPAQMGDLNRFREVLDEYICSSFMDEGLNPPVIDLSFMVVEEGVVVWCENGNVEEMNNCLFKTFDLQLFNSVYRNNGNPVTRALKQSITLKTIKTLRATLTFLSRTDYRDDVKALLKDGTFEERYDFLDKLTSNGRFTAITDFNKKQSKVEIYKDLAFYYAQLYALMNGNEIFTKSDACLIYPELAKYLLREEDASGVDLEKFIYEVLDEIIHSITFKPYGDAIRYHGENFYFSNKFEKKFE